MSILTYKSYFRDLAIRNRKLLHLPNSESPEAEAGTCKFTSFSQEDLIATKLRSSLSTDAVLHLHNYDWTQPNADTTYDVRRFYDAGFIVSQFAPRQDEPAIEAAYANTEQIVEELLDAMSLDYKNDPNHCGLPFGRPDLSKLSVTSVGPLWDGRYGWFVTFPFELKKDGSPAALRASVAAAFKL